jgi:protein TonB
VGPTSTGLGARTSEVQRVVDERQVDVAPRRIGGDEPTYPAFEALDGREGAVQLRLIVRADGGVADAQVVEVKGAPAFGLAAREAVLTWRFEPARKDGRVVDCLCTQRLAFKLGRSR